ncbi:MAG: hypothetical protein SFV22_02065 [Saprospiraceae bacterium]|nr:hypothetical protein [Saprospiraceae bacterium]
MTNDLMGNKVKVQLTKEQTDFLSNLPEQGMGYQIVDIKLKDGKVLNEKLVFNSTILQLDTDELIDPLDIDTIQLHEK